MAGLIEWACQGLILEIDGVTMHGPAWDLTDLTDLMLGGEVRGEDRILPGVAGVIALPRRYTVTRHSLPFVIDGSVDVTGQPVANPWIGLQDHLDFLLANVVEPTGVGDGTRAAVLHMPDNGPDRRADIHVLRLVKGDVLEGRMLATLEISIPAGVFSP